MMSVTTANDDLCKTLEPGVAPTSERFEALRTLANSGIYCGLLMIPILPYINDSEQNLMVILQKAKEAGAKFVYTYMGMTLRNGNREYYYDNLGRHFPGVAEKYAKRYGLRYNLSSPNYKKLMAVCSAECERLGLLTDMKAIIHGYKSGYENRQLTLF